MAIKMSEREAEAFLRQINRPDLLARVDVAEVESDDEANGRRKNQETETSAARLVRCDQMAGRFSCSGHNGHDQNCGRKFKGNGDTIHGSRNKFFLFGSAFSKKHAFAAVLLLILATVHPQAAVGCLLFAAVHAWRWSRRRPAQPGGDRGRILAPIVAIGGVAWTWRNLREMRRGAGPML